ncbi:hypothetical protein [Celeribacter arenosi]|uniref:Uncharacterized protein n=1 Tax=Celeribacter arenosi TaxID=792649 RepID=A0ABP7KJ19_9RHOB
MTAVSPRPAGERTIRALTLDNSGTGTEAGPEQQTPDAGENRVIFEATRSFEDTGGFLQMPGIEDGTEEFLFDIPEGLQLSLCDLAITEASALAGAEIDAKPAIGATGSARVTVRWSHPKPMGKVTFQLRIYASADATPPVIVVPISEAGADKRMRALVEQGAPVDFAIDGPLAEAFYEQVIQRGGQIIGAEDAYHSGTRPFAVGGGVGEAALALGVSLALIAAACVALGLITFGTVLLFAMSQGYDIDNAGYSVAVGEGESRQEHKMAFSMRKP